MQQSNTEELRIPVVRAKMLGVNIYRGFCELGLLSEISKADIYDQVNNPTGTQRDLNPKHAKEAYLYIQEKEFGFWPEVFLCARDKKILTFTPISDEDDSLGFITIDVNKIKSNPDKLCIARVDGNHRLHYGDGSVEGFTRVTKIVSFCLSVDLTKEEEIRLFKDINDNQKAMNTSHLDKIEVKLSPEEELKRRNPELYIAQKLGEDSSSPMFGKIYDGGKKPVGHFIPLRALKTGIEYMLSRSTQLPRLSDASIQYKVIRNYFIATKEWQPEAWERYREFLLLRGTGLWAVCFLGSFVIDKVLVQEQYESSDMLRILKSGRDWDWSKNGDFAGLSGRAGAMKISNRIARFLRDEEGVTTEDLMKKILESD
jgi:DGQHR domain-containing protein